MLSLTARMACPFFAKARPATGWWPSVLASCPRGLSTTRYRPVLPAADEVSVGGKYVLKFIDIQPPSSVTKAYPTIVLLHGSPGSFQDYEYLIPHLQDHARIIGINLPGNGNSVVLDASDDYYEHIRAPNLARAALDALPQR